LYADGRFSYLIILQGLDASGKDGLITNVLGAINPMGCSVKSFGVPTKEEAAHDFLWRIHKETPAKGIIKVFNRSHYEDLVMPQIHGTITKKEYQKRVEAIKNFEQLLVDNGTIIIKCFLHVSAERQKEKLEERMVNPKKHRKHKDDDFRKAAEYDKYIDIYSDVLSDTSWDHAPWHIIGSDKNFSKEYEFATILYESLKKLPLKWPPLETSMHVLKAVKQDIAARKKEKKLKKDDEKSSLGNNANETPTHDPQKNDGDGV
jgi:PPK2 family polyphosphate:nucleotide phosphotransferase